jgi:hypothetical protein
MLHCAEKLCMAIRTRASTLAAGILLTMGLASDAGATPISGSVANSENGCVHYVEVLGSGYSCSYNESSLLAQPQFAPHITVPWANVTGWQGPIYLAGFFDAGFAPGAGNPGGVIPGGKKEPLLSGDITVTGSGVSAQLSLAVSYSAADYSFNDGQGNFGDIHWGSLIYTLAGKTVDSASCNAGGCDYVIGSEGYPARLTAQVGTAVFPNEVAASGLGYWDAPVSVAPPPLADYPDTAGIASYEYRDPLWDTDVPGQTGQFVQNFGATVVANFGTVLSCVDTFFDPVNSSSACASSWNIMNNPDVRLFMSISTNAVGEVISGTAYAVREGDNMPGPGLLLGDSDAFAATVWTFAQTTETDTDGDGIPDSVDNCVNGANGPVIPDAYGTSQGDHDGDDLPNACDPDDDNDGYDDIVDGAPLDPTEHLDDDADGVGNNVDNCVFTPNGPLQLDPDDNGIAQRNTDGDAEGDACDFDDDNDGLSDADELLAGTDRLVVDTDMDGVNDGDDQYPLDEFQSGIIGDINGDSVIDVSDLLLMQRAISGLIILGQSQLHRADTHPVFFSDDLVDLRDLLFLQTVLRAQ